MESQVQIKNFFIPQSSVPEVVTLEKLVPGPMVCSPYLPTLDWFTCWLMDSSISYTLCEKPFLATLWA